MNEIDYEKIVLRPKTEESSAFIKEQIAKARKFLNNKKISMSKEAKKVLIEASSRGLISARSVKNIGLIAKSICALEFEEIIRGKHILNALQYRRKD